MSTGSITLRGGQVRAESEFRRVWVLTDFSSGAKAALKCARAIARRFHSRIFSLKATVFAEQEMQALIQEGKTH